MKENKKAYILLIFTILFFIVVNIQDWIEVWGTSKHYLLLFIVPALIICYILLAVYFIVETGYLITGRKHSIKKYLSLAIVAILLTVVTLHPRGFGANIFTKSKDLAIAYDNKTCGITIKLKENNRFIITDGCFAPQSYAGHYTRKSNAIYFQYDRESIDGIHYGVLLKEQDSKGDYVYKELLTYDIDTNRKPLHFTITEYNFD